MEDGKKPCGQCMEKVIAIINSNATNFTASDREWLLVQDEAVLDKLMPKTPVTDNAASDMMKKADCEKVKMQGNSEITSEQILKAMSAEDRDALAYGKTQLANKRANMIKAIQANTEKDLWPDKELNAMSVEFLEKLYNSVKEDDQEVVDYSLNGNSRRIENNTHAVAHMYPTGIEIETKK